MFLKTLRHTGPSIRNLILYMVNGMQNKDTDLMIAHNLRSLDIEDIIHDFIGNDHYRKQTRATTRWYHEILSIGALDADKVDDKMLERIAQKYIEMRSPNALCFAVAHTSEAHKHIHFCLSGTEFRNKTTLRMDNKTFRDLRVGFEKWQQKELPELQHSLVYLNSEKEKRRQRGKGASLEREYQTQKRLAAKGQLTNKQQLQEAVQQAFSRSRTKKQFYERLRQSGIETYERVGKITGVITNRKYRFTSIGITKSMLLSLDRFASRQREAEQLLNHDDGYELER